MQTTTNIRFIGKATFTVENGAVSKLDVSTERMANALSCHCRPSHDCWKTRQKIWGAAPVDMIAADVEITHNGRTVV